MIRTIKAKFSKGMFEPLEPEAAEMVREGEEVFITISTFPMAPARHSLKETAGGWKDLIDAEALKRHIYADRLIATIMPSSTHPPKSRLGAESGESVPDQCHPRED